MMVASSLPFRGLPDGSPCWGINRNVPFSTCQDGWCRDANRTVPAPTSKPTPQPTVEWQAGNDAPSADPVPVSDNEACSADQFPYPGYCNAFCGGAQNVDRVECRSFGRDLPVQYGHWFHNETHPFLSYTCFCQEGVVLTWRDVDQRGYHEDCYTGCIFTDDKREVYCGDEFSQRCTFPAHLQPLQPWSDEEGPPDIPTPPPAPTPAVRYSNDHYLCQNVSLSTDCKRFCGQRLTFVKDCTTQERSCLCDRLPAHEPRFVCDPSVFKEECAAFCRGYRVQSCECGRNGDHFAVCDAPPSYNAQNPHKTSVYPTACEVIVSMSDGTTFNFASLQDANQSRSFSKQPLGVLGLGSGFQCLDEAGDTYGAPALSKAALNFDHAWNNQVIRGSSIHSAALHYRVVPLLLRNDTDDQLYTVHVNLDKVQCEDSSQHYLCFSRHFYHEFMRTGMCNFANSSLINTSVRSVTGKLADWELQFRIEVWFTMESLDGSFVWYLDNQAQKYRFETTCLLTNDTWSRTESTRVFISKKRQAYEAPLPSSLRPPQCEFAVESGWYFRDEGTGEEQLKQGATSKSNTWTIVFVVVGVICLVAISCTLLAVFLMRRYKHHQHEHVSEHSSARRIQNKHLQSHGSRRVQSRRVTRGVSGRRRSTSLSDRSTSSLKGSRIER